MKVPFAIPECGDEEIEEVASVIKSGWLTTGHKCKQFEADFVRPLLSIALSLLLSPKCRGRIVKSFLLTIEKKLD